MGRSAADLRVVVDLDLGEQGNLLRGETKGHVSSAVSRRAWNTLPLLDARQDDIYKLGQKVAGVLVLHVRCDGHVLALAKAPANHVVPRLVGSGANVADGLGDHAGDVQMGAVLLGLGHHGVDGDLCDLGHVAEGARSRQQAELLTAASWPSQRSVLEVGRVAGPLAQAVLQLGRPVARGIVLVCEGEDVGSDGALVRLVQARQAERAGLEEPRGWIGGRRGLVRMERTAVVFGGTILVSGRWSGQALGAGCRCGEVPAGGELLPALAPQPAPGYGVEGSGDVFRGRRRGEGGRVLNLAMGCGRDAATEGGCEGADLRAGEAGAEGGRGRAEGQLAQGHWCAAQWPWWWSTMDGLG